MQASPVCFNNYMRYAGGQELLNIRYGHFVSKPYAVI